MPLENNRLRGKMHQPMWLSKAHKIFNALAALFASSTALLAAPVVINFDNLTGEIVTDQYAGVVFSSTPGNVNYVVNQPDYNGTPPNFLCTGPVGVGITCAEDTILTFSAPVSGLTFQALGIDNVQANVAQVDVWVGGILKHTVVIPGDDQGHNPELVDLSAYSDVTSIRIYNITDFLGIGWDTFSYDQSTTETPEPTDFVLFAAGLTIIFCIGRRACKFARPRRSEEAVRA